MPDAMQDAAESKASEAAAAEHNSASAAGSQTDYTTGQEARAEGLLICMRHKDIAATIKANRDLPPAAP